MSYTVGTHGEVIFVLDIQHSSIVVEFYDSGQFSSFILSGIIGNSAFPSFIGVSISFLRTIRSQPSCNQILVSKQLL